MVLAAVVLTAVMLVMAVMVLAAVLLAASLSPPVPLCPDAAEFLERAPLSPATPSVDIRASQRIILPQPSSPLTAVHNVDSDNKKDRLWQQWAEEKSQASS